MKPCGRLPDIVPGGLAGLDRRLLAVGVALLRRRHQARVHDLAGHRDVALLLQLPVEGLHHPPQRASLGQPVAEMADRVISISDGKIVHVQSNARKRSASELTW